MLNDDDIFEAPAEEPEFTDETFDELTNGRGDE